MSDTEPLSPTSAASDDANRELEHGHVLDGRYEIQKRIGSGGMGVVYAARRLILGDLVALKQLAPLASSNYSRSRFLLEARTAAHIRHPNVVEIFDFGEPEDDAPYIIMEYIDGPTLADVLHQGRLTVERALAIFAPICAAIEAGHRRGVVHRDLKPANIMVATSDDGSEVVKVLDFGLAYVATSHTPRLTQTGAIIGTARYMAPEQTRGEEVVPATDVFALGILLYEMVTGQVPFLAKTPVLTALKISMGEYIPPDEIEPKLPRSVVRAIHSALRQDPAQRPESPEQLARMAEGHGQLLGSLGGQQPGRASVDHGSQNSPVEAETANSTTAAPASPLGPGDINLSFDHFVGRERQLRRLHEEYDKAVGGSGRIVLVTGDAGIGKTRLVEYFVEQLHRKTPAMVLWGRFFDYRSCRPPAYQSFLESLRTGNEPDGVQRAVQQALEIHGQPESEDQRWRIFTALTEAYAARAGTRPLVLIFDDIQWATGNDLDLIDHLQRALAKRGTLLIATAREGEQNDGSRADLDGWIVRLGARRAHATLTLQPFDAREVRHWFDRSFGSIRIHPRDLKRLDRATGANPYCVVEVVRHFLADGTIDWQDGWYCQPLDAVELPETVNNLVRARLRDVDEATRRMLEIAAVIGNQLRFDTLLLATDMAEAELEPLVERARRLLLLTEEGVTHGNDYRFLNEVSRQVLYGDMPRQRRRRAHREVVAAIHTLYPNNLDRLAPVLAYHHHAVGDWPQALTWSLHALSDALEHSDNDAAAMVHTQAADALAAAVDVANVERDRFDHLTGILYRRLGRLEDAKTRLLRTIEQAVEPALGIAANLELAHCHLDLGDLEAAVTTSRAAERLAQQLRHKAPQLEARILRASCWLRLGQSERAAGLLDRLLQELDDRSSINLRSRVHCERAWALLKCGAFGRAQKHGNRALELARMAGDLLAQHHALSALAAVRGESGDPAGSLPLHRRALELSRRLSLRRSEAIDLANLGERFIDLSAPDRALATFREALAIFVEIGDRACEGDCRVNIGRTMLALGDGSVALTMLQRGRAQCEATGRTEYASIALLHEGEAHLALDAPAAASSAYAQAQSRFAELGSHHLWRADFGRARAARAEGDTNTALQMARIAAQRVAAQRAQLPSEGDGTGFDQATQAVYELLAEIEPLISRPQTP